jgi:hypothetical protein
MSKEDEKKKFERKVEATLTTCHDHAFKKSIETCASKVGHQIHDEVQFGFCVGREHAQRQGGRGPCMSDAKHAFEAARFFKP